jgi:hypothetical protein
MNRLPCLLPLTAKRRDDTDSVVLAVYAPFGTDPVLSGFPDGKRKSIRQHPLVKHLRDVARQGVHVTALIDLHDDDTYLIEIPAFEPRNLVIYSAWKQLMSAPQALAGFLRRTHQRFPCSSLVLALEGHGAGYLPDIDGSAITPGSTSGGGSVDWKLTDNSLEPVDSGTGAPILAVSVYPELPVESPEIHPVALPMSTWGLGFALRSAIKSGVPRPAVVHFNNCFNMSVELLHTVAAHADYATGYANYNFFTAGEAYSEVFKELRRAGSATREQLAKWFAAKNGAMLATKQNHPSVGATIALRRMAGVRTAISGLAKELTDALKSPSGDGVRARIRDAVLAAQQYDTGQSFQLQVPDQLTDLADFASQLRLQFPSGAIHDKAAVLIKALASVWQYGDFDRPWMDENQIWDFRNQRLGINILFPDPGIEGLWDWRSPYYMKNTLETDKPPAQAHVIDFLADSSGRSPWVKFLIEYHNVGGGGPIPRPKIVLLRAKPPLFPIFDRNFKPKLPHPTDDRGGCPPDPGQGSGGGDAGGRKPPGAAAQSA